MDAIRDLLSDLKEYNKTPEAVGMDLRLSLSEIVVRRLAALNWSQAELAKAAGMKASFVSRVIHASSNCTFDVAGRLLHALGVRGDQAGILVTTWADQAEIKSNGHDMPGASIPSRKKLFPTCGGSNGVVAQVRVKNKR